MSKTIQNVRDGNKVIIHADPSRTVAGSRMYIHAQDVADGLMHILNLKDYVHTGDYGHAHCPKFNLVGTEEDAVKFLVKHDMQDELLYDAKIVRLH